MMILSHKKFSIIVILYVMKGVQTGLGYKGITWCKWSILNFAGEGGGYRYRSGNVYTS